MNVFRQKYAGFAVFASALLLLIPALNTPASGADEQPEQSDSFFSGGGSVKVDAGRLRRIEKPDIKDFISAAKFTSGDTFGVFTMEMSSKYYGPVYSNRIEMPRELNWGQTNKKLAATVDSQTATSRTQLEKATTLTEETSGAAKLDMDNLGSLELTSDNMYLILSSHKKPVEIGYEKIFNALISIGYSEDMTFGEFLDALVGEGLIDEEAKRPIIEELLEKIGIPEADGGYVKLAYNGYLPMLLIGQFDDLPGADILLRTKAISIVQRAKALGIKLQVNGKSLMQFATKYAKLGLQYFTAELKNFFKSIGLNMKLIKKAKLQNDLQALQDKLSSYSVQTESDSKTLRESSDSEKFSMESSADRLAMKADSKRLATVAESDSMSKDVLVKKTVNYKLAAPGTKVTFTLVVQNLGDMPITQMWLCDAFPENFEILSVKTLTDDVKKKKGTRNGIQYVAFQVKQSILPSKDFPTPIAQYTVRIGDY